MKYELRENQGIPVPLLALMAVATGVSVANCYYNQPLLGSMAKDFAVNDFSASMVATLTQIGYVTGLVFVIPLGDLVSRKKLILANYIISSCALLAIALARRNPVRSYNSEAEFFRKRKPPHLSTEEVHRCRF